MGKWSLDQKISQLNLSIENHWIEQCLDEVRVILKERELSLPLEITISDDWYCLDGQILISIPFYIFDKSLYKFIEDHVGFCEGGTKSSAKKILLHELGHAFENAYGIKKLRSREAYFGKSSKDYPSSYIPNKSRLDYVDFLGDQYAQSHPDEDFAETFAFCLAGKKLTNNHSELAFDKVTYIENQLALKKGIVPRNLKMKSVDHYLEDDRTLGEFILERRNERRNFPRGLIKELLKDSFAKSDNSRHNKKSRNIFKELSFEIEKFFPNKFEAKALTNRLAEVVTSERMSLIVDEDKCVKKMSSLILKNQEKLKRYGWCRVPL